MIIWPLSVYSVRRQSAWADKREYVPGMPRKRQLAGMAVSAVGVAHAPLASALSVTA